MGRMLDALRRIDGLSAPLPYQEEMHADEPATLPFPLGEGRDEGSLHPGVVQDTREIPEDSVAPHPNPLPEGEGTDRRTLPEQPLPIATDVATEQERTPASRWWKPASPVENRDPTHAAPVNERSPVCAAPVEELGPACAEAVAHLLHEFPPGRGAVLLFCGPGPDDAAVPAVAALAVALASQVTGQILAVDGALHDTGLAGLLAAECEAGEPPHAGLADVVAGKVAWQQAVRKTRFGNLDVLPGQAVPAEESFALPAARWGAVLCQFRPEYQFVLIGVSPADAAAESLARWADATYLLIQPGQTGRRAARRAVHTLRQSGGRVLGCLVVEHSG